MAEVDRRRLWIGILASRSIRSSGGRSSRSGMRALVDALSETRPKSPASQVDNEEPIELAHYPDAMKPPPGAKPPIERDDFPAPPYPYTDPERRRRWSDTYKVFSLFIKLFIDIGSKVGNRNLVEATFYSYMIKWSWFTGSTCVRRGRRSR